LNDRYEGNWKRDGLCREGRRKRGVVKRVGWGHGQLERGKGGWKARERKPRASTKERLGYGNFMLSTFKFFYSNILYI
jgi:hypothetical protein